MEKAILLGNGLNRCSSKGISWGNLLEQIAVKHNIESCSDHSFPLEFERIVNSILEQSPKLSTRIYTQIKQEIADLINQGSLETNSLQSQYMNLPIDCILTTNYDTLLEAGIRQKNPDDHVIKVSNSERKYSVNRYHELTQKRIHYIHGEVSRPDSLCLGYEHYAGYLALIRKEMKSLFDEKEHRVFYQISNQRKHQHWMHYFFTHDLIIVGFGFSESELDLWWLITYRAYLFYSNWNQSAQLIRNRIVFYDLVPEGMKSKMKNLLVKMNVEVEVIEVRNKDYSSGYKTILKMIQGRI